MRMLFLTFFFLIPVSFLFAQEAGDDLFDESIIHQIRINSDDSNLLSNLVNEHLLNWPDNFVYRVADVTIDGSLLDSIGVRVKGGSTSFDPKSPLKIDFNFVKASQEYDGITKVNLHNIYFDNSAVREAVSYNILRTAGLKAPRTAYAEVYVNDDLQGLYLLVEQVNEPYLGRYFANENGVLYKDKGCQIAITSDNGTLEEYQEFDQIITSVSGDDLVTQLEDVADVSSVLQQILLQNLMNTADNIFQFSCNYYIYHEPKSSLLYWIPWDFNLSLYDNINDYPLENIINQYYDQLLSSDIYRQEYYSFACRTLQYNYTEERLSALMDNYVNLIQPALLNDPLIPFNPNGIQEEVEKIKTLIQERSNSFTIELEVLNFNCEEFTCPISEGDLVINEIVCSNDSLSGIADDSGAFPDWIELYNNTEEDIELGDFYLSDDIDFKKHWAFPKEATIKGNDYLIVWADRDVDEAGLHSDFKLAKSGGELFLMHEDLTIIDAMNYDEQTTNVGYARVPNGIGEFIMQEITFAGSNDIVNTNEINNDVGVELSPNPVQDILRIKTGGRGLFKYQVFSDTGITLTSGNSTSSYFEIATNEFSTGVYFLQLRNEEASFIHKFVKID